MSSDLDRRFQSIFVIWVALTGGVGLFAAVVWALTSGLLPVEWEAVAPFGEGLLTKVVVVPLLLLAAGVVVRRREIGRTSGPELFATAYATRSVVSTAVQEAGALLALLLCLLSDAPGWTLAVGGLSIFAMFLARPDRGEFERGVR